MTRRTPSLLKCKINHEAFTRADAQVAFTLIPHKLHGQYFKNTRYAESPWHGGGGDYIRI